MNEVTKIQEAQVAVIENLLDSIDDDSIELTFILVGKPYDGRLIFSTDYGLDLEKDPDGHLRFVGERIQNDLTTFLGGEQSE